MPTTLRPSLSEAQIDEIAAPFGMALPPEASVWWGWHDGTQDGRRPYAEPFPGWWLPGLGDALEQARWEWNEAVGLAGERAETLMWRSSWLPSSPRSGVTTPSFSGALR